MSLFKKITESEIKQSSVASLPTRPTADAKFGGRGLTPQEMKERYDKLPRLIAAYLNLLIDSLEQHYAGGTMPDDVRFDAKSTLREVVNGLLQSIENLKEDKVDSTDSQSVLYATDKDGKNAEIGYSVTAEEGKVPVYRTGGKLSVGTPTEDEDAAPKSYVDGQVSNTMVDIDDIKAQLEGLWLNKFSAEGGQINGDVAILGCLFVTGMQYLVDAEHLRVRDCIIETNSDGTTLTTLSGLAIHTGADSIYGIVYDPASDSVKLGLVTVDENGVYHFAEGDGSPVATRADSADMADGKVVAWNAANRRMETTEIPAEVDEQPTEGSQNLITSGAVYSAIVQTLNTEV